jgi:ankyrin repeat protein
LEVIQAVFADPAAITAMINVPDENGNMSLQLIVRKGNDKLFQDLMEIEGIDINPMNAAGETPFDLAIRENVGNIVFMLAHVLVEK